MRVGPKVTTGSTVTALHVRKPSRWLSLRHSSSSPTWSPDPSRIPFGPLLKCLFRQTPKVFDLAQSFQHRLAFVMQSLSLEPVAGAG